jgi:uncharacterized repeat protein (TIGR01451 family)
MGPLELDGNVAPGVLDTSGATTPGHDQDQVSADNHVVPLLESSAPAFQASSGATLLPQLQIVKEVTGGRDVIHPGDTASFTITVSNPSGAGDAFNVLVTDQLPAADLLTWGVTQSSFDLSSISTGDFLTLSSSRILAGETLSVTVSASIPADLFGPLFPVPPAGRLPGGPLELDGNAVNDPAVAGDDWSNAVFGDGGSSFAHSFVTDAVNSTSDDIFTGAARDTEGIQTGPWRFKESKPSAKNDISHAYAAASVDPNNGHVLLFAGLDRYDNSGAAAAGFWFFHNPIGENPGVTSNGGHPFTGQHADGDILLVSDFTRGGSAAIQVFRWTGDDSTGSLVPVTVPNGTAFAVANGAPIAVPWSFTDKGHNSGPAAGEFLEVGVDLTALGLGGCFSTFLAETRSSQSPTATLSDFVLGTFNTCRLDLPNTATVQADGIDPISSNRALITVVHEDVGLGASLGQSAPAPVSLVDSVTGSDSPPWRGGSIRGANSPPLLSDVLDALVAPAEHSPGQHVTSGASFAVTREGGERAALHVACVDRVFGIASEGNGLASRDGSDRDEDLLQATDDVWRPDWAALAPLEV